MCDLVQCNRFSKSMKNQLYAHVFSLNVTVYNASMQTTTNYTLLRKNMCNRGSLYNEFVGL